MYVAGFREKSIVGNGTGSMEDSVVVVPEVKSVDHSEVHGSIDNPAPHLYLCTCNSTAQKGGRRSVDADKWTQFGNWQM